jgi:hypothetical protein
VPLFKSGCYSEVDCVLCLGLGWLFLTGGRCSEVAINTGLTVLISFDQHLNINQLCTAVTFCEFQELYTGLATVVLEQGFPICGTRTTSGT